MLEKVLECRNVLEEFHKNVYNAVVENYSRFADNVVLGKKYRITPINAKLDMEVTVDNEMLQVEVIFMKYEDNCGELACITVIGYGAIPIDKYEKQYFPINFLA